MRKAQRSGGEKPDTKKPGAKNPASGRRKRIPYTKEAIHEIFHRFSLQRPEPKSELDYTNAFTMLVAVVLSAQATDAGVNKATKALFAKADSPAKMAALGEAEIGRAIRTIGLWRAKAKNVAALSEMLVRDFGGEVPDNREKLMQLPGVGRKTANVVLNNVFGEPTFAVDTHIFRLGNRLLLAPGKTPDEVEARFLRIIPPDYLHHAHHWLILHGRYVCKARRPECDRCIIADLCAAPVKTCDVPAPIVAIETTVGIPPAQ